MSSVLAFRRMPQPISVLFRNVKGKVMGGLEKWKLVCLGEAVFT